jgi:hypothetical protein
MPFRGRFSWPRYRGIGPTGEKVVADDETERVGRRMARFTLSLLSVAVALYALLAYASAFSGELALAFGALCYFAGAFFSTLIHECGHALAALACRWRIVVFAAGPIGIQVPNGNFALVPREFRRDRGGWVITVPTSPGADRAWRWSLILASGPLASLLLGAAALTAWDRGFRPVHVGVDTGQIALGLAIQGLRSCLFSLLPGFRASRTDGEKLWALNRQAGRYELDRPAKWLATLLASKVRLTALPLWQIERARNWSTTSPDMAKFVDTIDIGRALDTTPVDVTTARRLIEAFRAHHGTDEWLTACDVYLAALWEADPDRARLAVASIPVAPDLRPLSLAAVAAVAAQDGEPELARQLLQDMDKALKAESPFRDLTFKDIRARIDRLIVERTASPSDTQPSFA